MFNAAHLHLMLVHIPVVLTPLGCLLLLLGLFAKSRSLLLVSMGLLLGAGLSTIPGFLYGEGAEHAVEHIPGVLERFIEQHESAADVALWLSVLTAVVASVSLVATLWAWSERLRKGSLACLLLVSLAASAMLAYSANLGGKIRHPEAYELSKTSGQDAASRESSKEDDDD